MSLKQKVIFITDACSAIGAAIAQEAVQQGARVFMVGANEDELQVIQDEMKVKGFETAYAVADVAEYDQLLFAADTCLTTFAKIDTWINCAAFKLYKKISETSDQEAKRLFDTNFWGMSNGCKIAVSLMSAQDRGEIINLGSPQSDIALPTQGFYSASQHAIKGFTDALRRELLVENSTISVSLVIAERLTHKEVAQAILSHEGAGGDMILGNSAKLMPAIQKFMPKLQERVITLWYSHSRKLDKLKLFH